MSKQLWRLFVPDQAVGASLDYFDLFNATGTGKKVEISSVRVIVSTAVDIAAGVGIDLFLHRTTTVGTGGTAAVLQGATITAATFTTITTPPGALPTGITARLTPTGGATPGAIIGWDSIATEDNLSASFLRKELLDGNERIVLDEGSGILVRQGGIAGIGNIGFMVVFGLISK